MGNALVFDRLRRLYNESPVREITETDRFVILSDLHLGNGGRKDDFLHNSPMVMHALSAYYLKKGYTLVLNGDIEDFQKFSPGTIKRAWKDFFGLLDRFHRQGRLVRIWGNHDELHAIMPEAGGPEAREGIRLVYKGSPIFIFHGHQASVAFLRFNNWLGHLIRYIARPLGIMNDSVARNNRRKYKTEKRIYEYSSREKVISIIGHTHRPLFESLSKADTLRFRIENLCRIYPQSGKAEKRSVVREIGKLKIELGRILRKDGTCDPDGSIYESRFTIPSIFNSGCATGKSGFTCIEIKDGRIRLVHWFGKGAHNEHPGARELKGSGFFRVILKEDSLDYIFTRISLLA